MRDDAAGSRGHHSALDWIKALAILAVVLTHSGSGAFPGRPGYTGWDAVFAHLLPSFHVPCLLMVSGYLYRRPHPLGWIDVVERLSRILPPYLSASVLVLVLMPSRAPAWRDVAVALVSGNALAIYYYVFLLSLFVTTLPLLSRMPLRALHALAWVLLVALFVICWLPLVLSLDVFWSIRNPVESFAFGYFLLGWIAASPAPDRAKGSPRVRLAMTIGVALAWPVCVALGSPYPTILLAKIPYAIAVWMLAWRLFESKRVPGFVRRLSEASYGVFLYHYLFQEHLRPALASWPAAGRMTTLFVVGVTGSLLLGASIRGLVGPRVARRLFGY